jgi:5'-3' exonuclease
MKTLIIDGDNLFKIGLFGVKDKVYKDRHIGGLYHFINTLKIHLEQYRYDKIVVFWDGSDNKAARKILYPSYKENRRGKALNEVEQSSSDYQRTRIKQYLEELFVRQGEWDTAEADDCIAYYCREATSEEITIYSGDVDLTQLISETVKVYYPHRTESGFITVADKVNMGDGVMIPPRNVSVVKTLCGDSSDNVSGIQSMGVKTLVKLFPHIQHQAVSVAQIREEAEILFQTQKDIKALNNLLTGTSKHGVLGEEFFTINRQMVDLSHPLLTEEVKADIDLIISEPMDPTDRGWKNLMKMMMQDGLFQYLPQRDDAWVRYLTPLLQLARKEKNNSKNK